MGGVAESLGKAARRSGALLNLQVNLTTQCNLDCRHCYRVSERRTPKEELTTGQWLDVFRQAADLGALFVTFSGGEPLLRPDFDELIAGARQLKFAVSVLTNGTLVDRRTADRLAGFSPMRVQVSLYGDTAEVHDTVTGVPGSHRKTLQAAEWLVEREVPVIVMIILMESNAAQVSAMLGTVRDLGAVPQVALLLTAGLDGNLGPTRARATDAQLEALARDREILATVSEIPDPACPEERSAEATKMNMCEAGVTVLCVNADGTVWPCLTLPLEAGCVPEQPLEEIWRGAAVFQELRRSTWDDLLGCAGCELTPWCYRCPGDALAEGGGLRGISPEACRVARMLRRGSESQTKR